MRKVTDQNTQGTVFLSPSNPILYHNPVIRQADNTKNIVHVHMYTTWKKPQDGNLELRIE